MKDIFDKLSSYNIFNYLLPGFIFAVFAEKITDFRIIQADIVVTLFLCYFIGLCISRIGSLVVEPILKRTSFIRFAPYKDFVQATKSDPKLEILSEVNNMYRTICSLFVNLCLLIVLDAAVKRFQIQKYVFISSLCVVLALLFAWSYRKQTNYIANRIEGGKG